jgi:hypothetical protein
MEYAFMFRMPHDAAFVKQKLKPTRLTQSSLVGTMKGIQFPAKLEVLLTKNIQMWFPASELNAGEYSDQLPTAIS